MISSEAPRMQTAEFSPLGPGSYYLFSSRMTLFSLKFRDAPNIDTVSYYPTEIVFPSNKFLR